LLTAAGLFRFASETLKMGSFELEKPKIEQPDKLKKLTKQTN
jgi:hypothetical protein